MTYTSYTLPDNRRRLSPSSPAQWAYAGSCAVLTAGLLLLTVSGQPSSGVGRALFVTAGALFMVGGYLERSARTAVGGLVGAVFGNYLAVYAAPGHHYSHVTLGWQLAGVATLTVLAGRVLHAREQAAVAR